jgi:hypothetical protein
MKNKSFIYICVLLVATLLIWSCQDTTSSENPAPGKVRLATKSAETDAAEMGIDAEFILGSQPPRDGIVIQWHPVQDNDLIGYRVYRSISDSLTSFRLRATVRTRSAGRIDTSFFDTDTNLVAHTRYYYRVSAEDEDQEGPRSNSADYQLEDVCTLNYPPPFNSTFQWQWPLNGAPDRFIFRLSRQTAFGTYDSVLVKIESDYASPPTWSLSRLGIDSLAAGQYRWRIDIIGSEDNNGSESEWLNFSVP